MCGCGFRCSLKCHHPYISPDSTELAVRLLRVEPQRRRKVEAELRAGQAPTGAIGGGWGARREAVGEWLWAELFRDPGERARRLR